MATGGASPDGSELSDWLGLLPITRHDHPEPQTMVWSELELQAIRAYAGRCVAAERERRHALAADMQEYLYRVVSQVPFEHAQWGQQRGAAMLAALRAYGEASRPEGSG